MSGSMPPEEYASQLAHIDDDRSSTIIAVTSTFTVLALVAVILRFYARRYNRSKLSWEDYVAVAAMVAMVELLVAVIISAKHGVGRHLLWVIKNMDNMVILGKAQLGISMGYNFSVTLVKISILGLYARIFTMRTAYMRYSIWILATLVILMFISGTLSVFLVCRPLSSIWTLPTPCFPAYAQSVTFAVVGLVTDVAILVLPQHAIWKLHRSFADRLALSGIFLLGLFATVVTAARLGLLSRSKVHTNPYDSTWVTTETILFTALEPACIILCGSLPMAAGLFRSMRADYHKTSPLVDPSKGYVRSGANPASDVPSSYAGTDSRFRSQTTVHKTRSESIEQFELNRMPA